MLECGKVYCLASCKPIRRAIGREAQKQIGHCDDGDRFEDHQAGTAFVRLLNHKSHTPMCAVTLDGGSSNPQARSRSGCVIVTMRGASFSICLRKRRDWRRHFIISVNRSKASGTKSKIIMYRFMKRPMCAGMRDQSLLTEREGAAPRHSRMISRHKNNISNRARGSAAASRCLRCNLAPGRAPCPRKTKLAAARPARFPL